MFVKYSCGCVTLGVQGLRPIIVERCYKDHWDDPLELGEVSEFRAGELKSKTHTYLSPEESREYIRKLGMLVRDGHNFKKVKDLLS